MQIHIDFSIVLIKWPWTVWKSKRAFARNRKFRLKLIREKTLWLAGIKTTSVIHNIADERREKKSESVKKDEKSASS